MNKKGSLFPYIFWIAAGMIAGAWIALAFFCKC